jgi:pimeloyl-[acyl-carrier protein] methyl ester esterase
MSQPLVLLHGWGMNAAVWAPLIPALRAFCQPILLELPGHGTQPYQGEQSLSEWAVAVLKQAPEQAWWLGWSLGGEVALKAALDQPERVSGLLLTASSPCFVRQDNWPEAMPRGTLAGFAESLAKDYQGTLGRFLALQVRGSDAGRTLLRQLKQGLAQRPEADPAALAVGLTLLRETDLRAALAQLACDSHWLFGERDTLVPMGLANSMSALLPKATIQRLPGAAHAPFLSHPEAWLQWVRGALV